MSLLDVFRWLAHTQLGVAMRDSTWGFAIVEIGHLLALAVFGGAVLLLDLRFLGLGLRTQPISRVARELLLLTAGGVVFMMVSGFLMVANGPVRYYYNPAFRLKIILFVIALLFHFALQIWAARRDHSQELQSPWIKVAGTLSLVLWFSIGVAGRAIGYV
jgi:hypothetical protein